VDVKGRVGVGALRDRGALKTPGKAVAERLDRAIDEKIEEDRKRGWRV
jgi:hypothetical protein